MKKRLFEYNDKTTLLRVLSLYYIPVRPAYIYKMFKSINIKSSIDEIIDVFSTSKLVETSEYETKFIIKDKFIREKLTLEFQKEDLEFFNRYTKKMLYYSQSFLSYQDNYLNHDLTISRINLHLNKPAKLYYGLEFYEYSKLIIEAFLNKTLPIEESHLVYAQLPLFFKYRLSNFEPVDYYFKKLLEYPMLYKRFLDDYSDLFVYNSLLKGELNIVEGLEPVINDKVFSDIVLILVGEYNEAIESLRYKFLQIRNHFRNVKNPLISEIFSELIAYFSITKSPRYYTPLHNSWLRDNVSKHDYIRESPLTTYILKYKNEDYQIPILTKKFNGIATLIEIITYCHLNVIENWDIDYIEEIAYKVYKNEYYWVALELFYLLNKYDEVKPEWKKIYKKLEKKLFSIIPLASFIEYKSNKTYIFDLIKNDIVNGVAKNKNNQSSERIFWKLYKNNLIPNYQKTLKSGKWGKAKEINIFNYDRYNKYLNKADTILIKALAKFSGNKESALMTAATSLLDMDNIYNEYDLDNNIAFEIGKIPVVIYDTETNYIVTIDKKIKFLIDSVSNNNIMVINQYLYKVAVVNNATFQLLKEISKNKIKFNKRDKNSLKQLNYWIKNNKTLDIKSTFYVPENIKPKKVKPKIKVIFNIKIKDNHFHIDTKISPYPNFEIYDPSELGLTIVHKDILNDSKYFILKRNINKETEILKKVYNDLDMEQFYIKDYHFIVDNYYHMLRILEDSKEMDNLELRWSKNNKKITTKKLTSKDISWKIKSKNNWFQLDGVINFNSDEKQLLNLFLTENMKEKFIILDNGDIILLTKEFKKELDTIKSKTLIKDDQMLLPKYLAKDMDQLIKNGELSKKNKEWKKNLKKLNSLENQNIVIPKDSNEILRDYQKDGVKWITKMTTSGFGVCLADDMGLGKTIQTITSIEMNPKKTVIITPASVLYNWKKEIEKFAPSLQPILYEGKNRKKILMNISSIKEPPLQKKGQGSDFKGHHTTMPLQEGANNTNQTCIIVSYDTFMRDAEQFYKYNWGWIILDEAQMIKNPTTRRSKAIFNLKGEKRVALSGTPIENHLGELWSLFYFLDPILLGKNKNFNDLFMKPILDGDKDRKLLLKKILSPFLLRRLKKDVLKELPEKIEIIHYVEFNEKEKTYYETLRRKALETLESENNSNTQRIKILAHLTKLRQASCDISLAGQKISISSKTAATLQLIEDIIANKHKVLIFSQFTSYLDKIKKSLEDKKIGYLYLDGTTTKKKRAQLVNDFNTNNIQTFLISLKAGGTGINLTSANYVIHLDPWWNPAVEDQATDRTHRIGQNKNVTVYKMIVKNSIEEKIIKLHDSKKELSNSILDNMDKPNKLSIDDLMNMF